jgi:hypothetical protein
MFTRKVLVSALFAALMTGAALPAMAADRVDFDLHLNVAPPPPRYEVVPQLGAGYVWSPGYWEWRGGRHVWVPGSAIRARPGHVYHAPRWVQRDGRWHFQGPRWDRDGDGIPNRADRDRDNDGVPNRLDRDRDGDRVPNRFDNRPANPSRY